MKWLIWILWSFYVAVSAPDIIGDYSGSQFFLGLIIMLGLVLIPWIFLVGSEGDRY